MSPSPTLRITPGSAKFSPHTVIMPFMPMGCSRSKDAPLTIAVNKGRRVVPGHEPSFSTRSLAVYVQSPVVLRSLLAARPAA
jgi:hypothetical protein